MNAVRGGFPEPEQPANGVVDQMDSAGLMIVDAADLDEADAHSQPGGTKDQLGLDLKVSTPKG